MKSGVSLTAERLNQSAGGGSKPTTPLHKSAFWVRDVSLGRAHELVAEYHYAMGGANTATFLHGLFPREATAFEGDCLGVAWWIPPTRSCAEATHPAREWQRVLSLTRLVLLPAVPKNAASFLLTKSAAAIKRDGRFNYLVTYADTWRGHTGAIYRAAGWTYAGLTKAEAVWTDVSGRMVARKAGPKTRTKAEMESLGFLLVGRFAKHKFVLDLRKQPPPRSGVGQGPAR